MSSMRGRWLGVLVVLACLGLGVTDHPVTGCPALGEDAAPSVSAAALSSGAAARLSPAPGQPPAPRCDPLARAPPQVVPKGTVRPRPWWRPPRRHQRRACDVSSSRPDDH